MNADREHLDWILDVGHRLLMTRSRAPFHVRLRMTAWIIERRGAA